MKKNYWLAFGLFCLLVSCNNNGADHTKGKDYDVEYEEPEETFIPDTIDGQVLDEKTTEVNIEIDDILHSISDVKSPSMLMRFKYQYPELLANLKADYNNLSAADKEILKEKMESIKTIYKNACREYEVDPEGIIINLTHMISNVQKVKTKEEYDLFESSKYGTIVNLDKVQLATHDNSSKIPEIKNLARKLDGLIREKKRELGIEDAY